MKVTPIANPLSGEHVAGVQPPLKPDVDAGWHRRLNLYTGRALSDTALKAEQDGRGGRLATRGQMVSPGVVSGLETQLEQGVDGAWFCHVGAGLGLAAGGEDVVVPTGLRAAVTGIRVYAPSTVLLSGLPEGEDPAQAGYAPNARDVGGPLGDFMTEGSALPRVGVLVLQPIVAEIIGNFDNQDPCERDPANDAFDDWQLVDGCRLLYYAWPAELLALPPQPADPAAYPGWRNAIAYAVFAAEASRGPDDPLPWEEIGVPVGLMAFDTAWALQFLDRFSVVRNGGKPRRRRGPQNTWRVAAGQSPGDASQYFSGQLPVADNPCLWQARMQQMAEQIAEAYLQGTNLADLAGQLAFLPPAGLLPREALDFVATGPEVTVRTGPNHFFPSTFDVQAVPIPLEQLDAAIQASASLAPFSASTPDQASILVPVPQQWFEPALLQVEQVNPEFQATLDQLVIRRGRWLTRRLDLRDKVGVLARAISGQAPTYPSPDPDALEPNEQTADAVDPNDPQLQDLEGDYGTAVVNGVRVATAFAALRENLRQTSPLRAGSTVAVLSVRDEIKKVIPEITDRLTFSFVPIDTQVMIFTGVMSADLRDKLKSLGTDPASDQSYINAVDQLYAASQNDELGQLDVLGLSGFITYLQDKVNRADDRVDFGFLRIQTDIYRVRQLVLGTANATRLATSPTLATIAQGSSAVATREDVANFYTDLKGMPVPAGTIGSPPDTGAAPAAAAPEAGPPSGGSGGTPPAGSPSTGGTPEGGTPGGAARGGSAPGAQPGAQPPASAINVLSTGIKIGVVPTSSLTLLKGTTIGEKLASTTTSGLQVTGTIPATRTGVFTASSQAATPIEIVGQNPVVGAANIRTVTIAERLETPKAPEAQQYSVSSKYDVISGLKSLADTGMTLDDIQIPGMLLRNADNQIEFDEKTGQPLRTVKLLKDIDFNADILSEPTPHRDDESAYFVGAVELLDHTIAALRATEGRIQQYRLAIAACQKTLGELQDQGGQASARLQAIGDELAEARQDVSIARALLAEEQQRVQDINDRRDQVIAEQVKFLAFCRPRFAELRVDTPVRTLDPGLLADAVPACLADTLTPPPDLRAMVDLFRDAPVRWFTHVPRLLDFIDALPALQATLIGAQVQANLRYAVLPQIQLALPAAAQNSPQLLMAQTFSAPKASTTLGQSIQRVFSAQQQVVAQTRLTTAQLDLSTLDLAGWRRVRQQANDNLSLGDLISGAHGRSNVSQSAAAELDDIAGVATCLYGAFGRVLPIIRLQWAEILSQYDAPVDLRLLSNLPRWGQIAYADRQEMQDLATWLYGRMDLTQPAALALMNDLVRVCLLLASHAPINAILAGAVAKPVTATAGSRIDLTVVDVAQVNVGMNVLVYNQSQVVARAVVEDLAAGQVSARVLAIQAQDSAGGPAASVQLASGARVQFTRMAQ